VCRNHGVRSIDALTGNPWLPTSNGVTSQLTLEWNTNTSACGVVVTFVLGAESS
jgi:hypothetical protein